MVNKPRGPTNTFDKYPKSKFLSKKNNIIAYNISATSRKKLIFDCACGHEFEMAPYFITTRNYWCGYCCKKPRYICGKIDCKPCFKISFASHPRAKYWSSKNKKFPYQCMKSDTNKYLFNCFCGHEIEKELKEITHKNSWCGYCCIAPKYLCDNDNCKPCFERSFASHPRSKYWSSKNEKTARQCMKASNSKYIFDCICGHEFLQLLGNITCIDTWCPYCCFPAQKLCNKVDCKQCFNNSFASHSRAISWSDRNNDKPRDISKCIDKKRWFKCEYDHEFYTRISNITSSNTWCSVCKNKTESKLYEHLSKTYKVIKEARFDWCRSVKGNQLPFDFLLEDLEIIIELDGIQHFEDVVHFRTTAVENLQIDKFKMQCALDNGYKVIRIYQPDVFSNEIDWETGLLEAINDIKDKYYLASNPDIYDNLINLLNDTKI